MSRPQVRTNRTTRAPSLQRAGRHITLRDINGDTGRTLTNDASTAWHSASPRSTSAVRIACMKDPLSMRDDHGRELTGQTSPSGLGTVELTDASHDSNG